MQNQRCEHCNREFQPVKSWQRFCTARCRDAWHYEQWKLALAEVGQVNGQSAESGIVEAMSVAAPAEPIKRRRLGVSGTQIVEALKLRTAQG
jgi:hypothetical protein